MNIIEALRNEEAKLQRQLRAIQGAIAALNGSRKTVVSPGRRRSSKGVSAKRTMSAVTRAKIRRSANATWAKIRAGAAKKEK